MGKLLSRLRRNREAPGFEVSSRDNTSGDQMARNIVETGSKLNTLEVFSDYV
jgi:hypothetical protein